jgi:ABC-type lipoprotein export system ATPase subunit
VREPLALLLDEPTGPLDEQSTAEVEALLKGRMAAGVTVVLVTHDPDQAARFAGPRYRMQAGKLEPP